MTTYKPTQKPTYKPWYTQALFYHMYPLGLCGAPAQQQGAIPTNRLSQLHQWIPHLKKLHVNALYLGPLQKSESHGYDPVDYFQVDPRLGTTEELQALIQGFHTAGIRVIFDAVLNHVSRDFFAFQDLLQQGQASRYVDWFADLDFSQRSPYGDPFAYAGWSGHYNLVKLNLKHPEVCEHLLQAVRFWIDTFAIDGLRLDAADVMDLHFLQRLAQETAAQKPDFWLMGEVVHGDYRQWANTETLHATTNYECYKGLYSSHNDRNYFEIAHSLERLFHPEKGLYRHLHLYNFADNHDVERVASRLEHLPHVYPLYLLLYTIPGAPSLYYGSEWGIAGAKQVHSDTSLRPALPLDILDMGPAQALTPDLLPVLQNLGRIRQQSSALQQGNYLPVHVASEQLVFLRDDGQETYLVAVNASDQTVQLAVTLPAGYQVAGPCEDLLNAEVLPLQGAELHFDISPCWGRIVRIVVKNMSQ